jgi:hydrogenase nickel incorporation protein HypA/HybF
MHELSMCLALIGQVEGIARQHRATSVTAVIIQIGPLSGVEPELLAQAFPLASAGTVAERSRLVIENLPIRVRCKSCGAETAAVANKLICGKCGDWQTQLLSGDEMLLASVELENNVESGMANAQ